MRYKKSARVKLISVRSLHFNIISKQSTQQVRCNQAWCAITTSVYTDDKSECDRAFLDNITTGHCNEK